MRVLFWSGGSTGSGHIVTGLSLLRAFERAGLEVDYRILSVETPFACLGERFGAAVMTVPVETADALGRGSYEASALYRAISAFGPDVLIVDWFWFTLDAFIGSLPCKKVFLSRQIDETFFSIRLPGRELRFRPGDYDLRLRIEPSFDTPFPSALVDPVIIRDRDEIKPAGAARAELGLSEAERSCLFAFNGKEGEGAEAWKSFSYLEDEGWTVLRSDNRAGGLFPAVDWYRGFDLLVCGAGYSSFWEARYLDKEAFFVPFPRRFESQARRVAACSGHVPAANGADRIARLIMDL